MTRPVWRNVVVISCTIFGTLTGITCWWRVMANHFREWGATPTQIGLVLTLATILSGVSQMAGGILSDRVGRKRIIATVTALMSGCYAGIGLAPTWGWAALALAACWFASGVQWPSLLALLTESVPERRRGTAIAAMMAASVAGSALGPFVGAQIEVAFPDRGASWRVLLLFCAGIYFVAACLRAALLEETHVPADRAGEAKPATAIDWRLVAMPAVVGILAGAVWNLTVEGPAVSLYLEDELGRGREQIDYVFFLAGLVALVGAPLAGWSTDRLGAERMIRWSFLLIAVILVPFGAAHWMGESVQHLWPGLAVCLFVALAVPAQTFGVAIQKLIASQTGSSGRGAHIGAYSLVTGLLAPWTLLAGGWSYHAVGHSFPFGAAAGFGLAGLLASFLLRPGRGPVATTADRPSTSPSPNATTC